MEKHPRCVDWPAWCQSVPAHFGVWTWPGREALDAIFVGCTLELALVVTDLNLPAGHRGPVYIVARFTSRDHADAIVPFGTGDEVSKLFGALVRGDVQLPGGPWELPHRQNKVRPADVGGNMALF